LANPSCASACQPNASLPRCLLRHTTELLAPLRRCCDDIFLPSFFFKNAYGFPQDRGVLYSVYVGPEGGVMWEVRVHGIFYQPLDFSHFPFDSFDLTVELRFYDPTSSFDDTEELLGGNHTGVSVVPSSGGKKVGRRALLPPAFRGRCVCWNTCAVPVLSGATGCYCPSSARCPALCSCLQIYTVGRGDDASSWAVTDFTMEVYSVDFGAWWAASLQPHAALPASVASCCSPCIALRLSTHLRLASPPSPPRCRPHRFADFSDLPSNDADPLPLNPSNVSISSGYAYEDGTPINVFT
jgi:hypothetical protein